MTALFDEGPHRRGPARHPDVAEAVARSGRAPTQQRCSELSFSGVRGAATSGAARPRLPRAYEPAQLAVTVARTAETRVTAPLFVAVVQDDRRSASVPTPATWERHARRAAVPAVVGLRSAFALW